VPYEGHPMQHVCWVVVPVHVACQPVETIAIRKLSLALPATSGHPLLLGAQSLSSIFAGAPG
jgi:hypothetical protein